MLVLCLFIEGLYSCLTDQFSEVRQNALKLFRKFILSTCCVSGMLDIVAHYSYFDSNIPGEHGFSYMAGSVRLPILLL